jgi:putative hydrolase of HD superfamily
MCDDPAGTIGFPGGSRAPSCSRVAVLYWHSSGVIESQELILPSLDEGEASRLDADAFLDLMKNLALEPYRIMRAITVPDDRERHENDAEHSFSLGIAALCLAPLMSGRLNMQLVCTYALIHDLAEIYAGDTPVYATAELQASKEAREKAARVKLQRRFGSRFPWLIRYIDNYAAMQDEESKFVYALDKILPHAVVIISKYHPARPTRTAYQDTELIARAKIDASYPELSPLFDELCQRYIEISGLFAPEGDDGLPSRARDHSEAPHYSNPELRLIVAICAEVQVRALHYGRLRQ